MTWVFFGNNVLDALSIFGNNGLFFWHQLVFFLFRFVFFGKSWVNCEKDLKKTEKKHLLGILCQFLCCLCILRNIEYFLR